MTIRPASLVFPRVRRGALLIATMVAAAACIHADAAPADRDYSRTRISSSGAYRATIAPEIDPVPVGRMHSWTFHVERVDGTAVDSATIRVNGGMPEHGHGLPTKPSVTRALGGGDHRVEGMKFNMRGWWTLTFTIASGRAPTDSVTFNLKL